MINFQDHFIKLHLYNPLIGHKTFQFSPKDSISDLRNTVCETTELMMYENFHFQHENKVLSQFLQMGQTLSSGSKINIVFDCFDQRSSKFHYYKIKNILQNPSILVSHNISFDEQGGKRETVHKNCKISQNVDILIKCLEKEQFMDDKKMQLQYNFSQWVNLSGYNPIPYYRRLMGDYYYIHFKSPEQIDYHITGHTEGFYINQSTNSHFNPNISIKNTKVYISLLELLYSISPKFKLLFKTSLNKIKNHQVQKSLIGPLANKKNQWIKEKKQNHPSWKTNPLERTTKKDQILTIKDWNQMFQIQRLEPSSSLYEKINRQKLKFKIYQQFVDHSKIGAISIIDKQILPINPNCPKKEQTFLFTNIYFSFIDNSFEEKDFMQLLKSSENDLHKFHKKDSKVTNNYILSLELIDNKEGLDFHLSHSVLVQYKGQKLRAQSFPSGLIHTKAKDEPIQKIIQRQNYINSNIHMKEPIKNHQNTVNKEIIESLLKLTFKLNLQHDIVVKMLNDDLKIAKKVAVSTEIKGVQTSDKRKYLFNLHSLLPKDYNFLHNNSIISINKQNNNSKQATCIEQALEFQFYNFDDFVYRPQLISLYNQKLKCRIPINCMLGKTLQNKYQIVMNEKLRSQQKKLKALASFAKDHVINMVINCLEGGMKKYVADSKNIVQIMHRYGLNVRYLGFLYKKIDKKKSPHLSIIIQKVIYIKCIKNIINTAMKTITQNQLKLVISHLLNCIFYPNKINNDEYSLWKNSKEQQIQQNNQVIKKKKKRNKDKQKEDILLSLYAEQGGDFFSTLKSSQFNQLIVKIAKLKYHHQFQFNGSTVQPKIFKFLYGKKSVLRDICLNSGIILQKRDYFCLKQPASSNIFLPQNVFGFFPRCTHTTPDTKQLDHLISEGDNFLSQFYVEESIDSYNKAIQYILTTFGGNNQKLPLIHKKLSFIYFKIGDIQTALLFANHSLAMFEQFYGLEHVETIDNLAMLGIYHCAERSFSEAQQCLLRALYYAYMSFGEVYPEILSLWLNLSTIYEIQKQYTDAIMCIYEGLKICLKIFTQTHLNTSIYFAALSALHFQIPDIMNAIKFKQRSLSILQKLLPENDQRIKQSIQMIDYMKSLQSSKKVKEFHQKQLRKLQNSTYPYHPSQMGAWQYNPRNGRANPSPNIINFNNRNLGRIHEYFTRQNEEYWRRTVYGGRRVK